MFPNVNCALLPTHNGLDREVAETVQTLFEQEVILDFSNSMSDEVYEHELSNLARSRITWAYLIEECWRVNSEIRKVDLYPAQMVREKIIDFLDVEELSLRYRSSPIMKRCLLSDDISMVEQEFDKIIVTLTSLIARIVHGNSETLNTISSQLMKRLKESGCRDLVSFHCIGFRWVGRVGVVKFGAYRLA